MPGRILTSIICLLLALGATCQAATPNQTGATTYVGMYIDGSGAYFSGYDQVWWTTSGLSATMAGFAGDLAGSWGYGTQTNYPINSLDQWLVPPGYVPNVTSPPTTVFYNGNTSTIAYSYSVVASFLPLSTGTSTTLFSDNVAPVMMTSGMTYNRTTLIPIATSTSGYQDTSDVLIGNVIAAWPCAGYSQIFSRTLVSPGTKDTTNHEIALNLRSPKWFGVSSSWTYGSGSYHAMSRSSTLTCDNSGVTFYSGAYGTTRTNYGNSVSNFLSTTGYSTNGAAGTDKIIYADMPAGSTATFTITCSDSYVPRHIIAHSTIGTMGTVTTTYEVDYYDSITTTHQAVINAP